MQQRQIEQSAEQEYVDALYARLDGEVARVRADLDDAVRTSSTDPEEAFTRDVRVGMLTRRARTLDAAEHHLCFGRIDHTDGRSLHIGRTGLSDGDDQLLVDWRADAARPFYAATAAHPMGLHRRRHLGLDGRRIARVSDEILDGAEPGPHDVIGDGPLLAAISARRTGRMRDVVSTLQSEQDAIIRSAHRGVTVVEGGPGTGKTVVALHRAAYVLAGFAEARADGVLVLGPGSRFLDYIAEVLPSLGENDVAMSTPDRLVADALGLETPPGAGHELRRAAGDVRLADQLAEAVRRYQAPSGTLAVVVDGDAVTLDEHALAETRETAAGSNLPHNQARALFKDLVVDFVADEVQARARVLLAKLDEDIEVLTGGVDVDRAAAKDLEKLGFGPDEGGAFGHAAAVAELDPGALRAELLDDLALEQAVESAWPRLAAGDVVLDVLDEHPALAVEADGVWTTAHLPLLDEAEHLLNGPPATIYGHVVVDEAQELTPMQWRAVLRRCPGRSMTVVGDLAQAGPATGAGSWADALGSDLAKRADVRTLTVCYRTTAEVLEAAAPLRELIAPDQAPAVAVRHGVPPRRVAVTGELVRAVVEEAEAQVAAGPDELVAVLAADAAVPGIAEALAGTDVRVVPVSQVRGLEFDAVVVADPDGITAARPGGERDLYVALTRPTQRLVIVG
ncbi:DNA helicase IV [Promicromonospora umidemergens]|uniref:UvrD-like helicase ATP-binding domain-containing protein n=1 Tax=Promicromonospora umidemergens TaxID=629679 RepID=A0ABP8WM29_9MICO|nr:ATP-binding domain-containing protein [Promicromonospora umidemergens]MCP2283899.1 DNA helicase IV [Promicromonospora umidemergens]